MVAWNWKAGGTAVSNTDGSITSQVSANTDAGFSIISWVGSGAAGSIGHGLNKAPELSITKNRDAVTYATVRVLNAYDLILSLTGAHSAGNANHTTTATTINLLGSYNNTLGQNSICWAFHSVDGFSKVGSYTGNGSTDGAFVYTGFRPAWVMIKRTDGATNWIIMDSARNPYNIVRNWLYANLSSAEAPSDRDDLLSNGFKIRQSGSGINASGGTYIYLAFAENPFKYANAR